MNMFSRRSMGHGKKLPLKVILIQGVGVLRWVIQVSSWMKMVMKLMDTFFVQTSSVTSGMNLMNLKVRNTNVF